MHQLIVYWLILASDSRALSLMVNILSFKPYSNMTHTVTHIAYLNYWDFHHPKFDIFSLKWEALALFDTGFQ